MAEITPRPDGDGGHGADGPVAPSPPGHRANTTTRSGPVPIPSTRDAQTYIYLKPDDRRTLDTLQIARELEQEVSAESAHDRCLKACSYGLSLCMADAHTGPSGAPARERDRLVGATVPP
jgi:hypothetical protein